MMILPKQVSEWWNVSRKEVQFLKRVLEDSVGTDNHGVYLVKSVQQEVPQGVLQRGEKKPPSQPYDAL